ncbi:MAG TPA: helix-turn-helix transcriptional regulator [Bradyrhizobium sp.]|jgi:transcriptional regulator with XRE-family HTH domain|nr:helix-turn-helix transcriptional regulator [Bradyrhizobium sp.]
MPSFQIAIEPNRRAAARFVGQVRRAIQKAFAEEQKKRGLSQADIARTLGVNRSVINRELKGFKDITLGRVAELAWVMGRKPSFNLDEQIAAVGQNIPPVLAQQPIVEIKKEISTTNGTRQYNFNPARAA